MDIIDRASRHEEMERSIRLQEHALHTQHSAAQADLSIPRYCKECEREIPKRRLQAVPWTTLCVECQALLEMKR